MVGKEWKPLGHLLSVLDEKDLIQNVWYEASYGSVCGKITQNIHLEQDWLRKNIFTIIYLNWVTFEIQTEKREYSTFIAKQKVSVLTLRERYMDFISKHR